MCNRAKLPRLPGYILNGRAVMTRVGRTQLQTDLRPYKYDEQIWDNRIFTIVSGICSSWKNK
jgi:hypothetical protein